MKHLLLGILAVCYMQFSVAQDTSSPKKTQPQKAVKWLLGPSIGNAVVLPGFLRGDVTDGLTSYGKEYFMAQLLHTVIFLHKNWGLDISLNISPDNNNSADAIAREVTETYEGRFFTKNSAVYNTSGGYDSPLVSGFLGLTYKYEAGRLLLMPVIRAGVTSTTFYSWSARLKERDRNNHLLIQINPDTPEKDGFAFGTGFTIGCRLAHNFYINADCMYYNADTKVVFKRTEADLSTNTVVASRQYNYHKNLQSLALNFGVLFRLK